MPKLKKSLVTSKNKPTIPPPFVSDYPGRAKLKTLTLPPSEAITVEFPFGPKDISLDALEIATSEIQRPYRKPILAIANPQLKTVSFTAMIADKMSGGMSSSPVQQVMDDLERIAANGLECKFTYGLTALNFTVVITRLSFNIQQVNGNGEPIRVEANIQLTESPLYTVELVQLNVVYNTPEITESVQTSSEDDPDDYETQWVYWIGGEALVREVTIAGGTETVKETMNFL